MKTNHLAVSVVVEDTCPRCSIITGIDMGRMYKGYEPKIPNKIEFRWPKCDYYWEQPFIMKENHKFIKKYLDFLLKDIYIK